MTDSASHAAALSSAGVQSACMTWLQPDGSRRAYLPDLPMSRVLASIEFWAAGSRDRGTGSLVIRPAGNRIQGGMCQLDDIPESALARVLPLSLFCLETSPGSWQAWLALAHDGDAGAVARALKTATGADSGASGACRVAGSRNCKEKYGGLNGPIVKLLSCQPGRLTTPAELVSAGVLPTDWRERQASPPVFCGPAPGSDYAGIWPDYAFFLASAVPARTHSGPDRSRVDFTWALCSLKRGLPPGEVASRLAVLSEKARERLMAGDDKYVASVVGAARNAYRQSTGGDA